MVLAITIFPTSNKMNGEIFNIGAPIHTHEHWHIDIPHVGTKLDRH